MEELEKMIILNINDTVEAMCVKTGERVSFNKNEFDTMIIRVGRYYETTNIKEVPYSLSSQRREDIRAHHREEAECGNI